MIYFIIPIIHIPTCPYFCDGNRYASHGHQMMNSYFHDPFSLNLRFPFPISSRKSHPPHLLNSYDCSHSHFFHVQTAFWTQSWFKFGSFSTMILFKHYMPKTINHDSRPMGFSPCLIDAPSSTRNISTHKCCTHKHSGMHNQSHHREKPIALLASKLEVHTPLLRHTHAYVFWI